MKKFSIYDKPKKFFKLVLLAFTMFPIEEIPTKEPLHVGRGDSFSERNIWDK